MLADGGGVTAIEEMGPALDAIANRRSPCRLTARRGGLVPDRQSATTDRVDE
jgi:hypothetical protein